MADKDQDTCSTILPSIQRSPGIRWCWDNCDHLSGMKKASLSCWHFLGGF